MALLGIKGWFRNQLKPFWKVIKENTLNLKASNLSDTLTTAERNIIQDKISSSYRFNPRFSLYRITTFPTNSNGSLYMTVYNAYTTGYQAVLKTQFSSRFNNFKDTKVFPFERTTDIRCGFELWDNGDGTSSLYLKGHAIYPVKLEIHRNEAEFPILIEKVGNNDFIPSGTKVTDTTGLPELYLDNQSDALITHSTQTTKDKWKTELGVITPMYYNETDFDFLEDPIVSNLKLSIVVIGKFVSVNGFIQVNASTYPSQTLWTMPSNLRPKFFDGVFCGEPFSINQMAVKIDSAGRFSTNVSFDSIVRFNFHYETV